MTVTNPTGFAFSQTENFVKLLPSDDAHVIADLSDPSDSQGLMQTNVGNLESIELLSSWNATENQNAFVTVGYLKFDLSKQNTNNLEKAELKMLVRDAVLSTTAKSVALLHVPNNNWSESDITYIKKPNFSTTITSSTEISAPNTWYSWDVTDLVMQNPAAQLSVAITFETAQDNVSDYVAFYSKEFENKNNSPHLALYYTTDSPSLGLSAETSNYLTIGIIGGVIGAAAASFVTRSIITKKKTRLTNEQSKQSTLPPEKVQCKSCGRLLPRQFKFCPFCSTQISQ